MCMFRLTRGSSRGRPAPGAGAFTLGSRWASYVLRATSLGCAGKVGDRGALGDVRLLRDPRRLERRHPGRAGADLRRGRGGGDVTEALFEPQRDAVRLLV